MQAYLVSFGLAVLCGVTVVPLFCATVNTVCKSVFAVYYYLSDLLDRGGL